MTQESIASLIPIILTLFIGLVLGGLIGAVIASSMQGSSQAAKAPPNRNLRQVAGLWRDKRNGKIAIEMDEKYFSSIEKLPSRQVPALMQAFNDLQIWLNVNNLSSRLGATPRIESGVDKQNYQLQEQPILEVQSPLMPEVDILEPVKVDVGEIVTRAINPKANVKVKEPPKSIVEQVDEILQKHLEKSPLSNRLIRLVDAPGGGVEVLVDTMKYEGVNEVPDLEVRNLIQECVKEWETKK